MDILQELHDNLKFAYDFWKQKNYIPALRYLHKAEVYLDLICKYFFVTDEDTWLEIIKDNYHTTHKLIYNSLKAPY